MLNRTNAWFEDCHPEPVVVHNKEASVYMQHPKANQILRDKLIIRIESEIIDGTRKAKPDKTYLLLELSGIKNENDEIPNLGAVE